MSESRRSGSPAGGVVLFLSELLGTAGTSRKIRRGLSELQIRVQEDVRVTPDDFRGVASWRRVLGDTREVMAASRTALRRAGFGNGVVVVVNGWEMGLVALGDPRVDRIVLAMDALPTPALLRADGFLAAGPVRSAVRTVSSWAHTRELRRRRGRIAGLLPVSAAVAAEARRMLGDIPVEVTLSPQARIAGSPEKLGPRTPFRAVLIGHDLARKGGEAFAAGVAEAARIAPVTGALVTGDRLGEVLAECYGLELITGVDSAAEVHRLFREADVSVLPTRRDRLPNVIAESIAAGTPVMAPPIGAIPELVIARRTGWLLPVNPDASDVASCLVQAATSDRMDAMRSTTLDFARAHLSWDVFVGKLATVMEAALR